MTPAQEILGMIEGVDPNDKIKLEEIDAMVFCYVHHGTLGRINRQHWNGFEFIPVSGKPFIKGFEQKTAYTRSRDAIKSIRPEGWSFSCGWAADENKVLFCSSWNNKPRHIVLEAHKGLPTEELAELHAVIQAIEHDRSGQKGSQDV